MLSPDISLLVSERKQAGLMQSSSVLSGIGLHTGKFSNLRLCPAPENTGVVFRRVDLPGAPEILACVDHVVDTSRLTTLGKDGILVHTVEHLLAALKALSVDNVFVELDGPELPILNGASDQFVAAIEEGGRLEQEGVCPILKLERPVHWSNGDIHLVALPYDGLKFTYTMHYPQVQALGTQYVSLDLTAESFIEQIASCRTFCLYEEVKYLVDRTLIQGASLESGVVVWKDCFFAKDGLHFPDEMGRHKLLDLIGDLSLVGMDYQAHVIAVKSGHESNAEFARLLYQSLVSGGN
ncbi:MAG: UDP-3-O-[3-hydroxymyristoyl] N-acetylglucosamine deacetylase [Waddliaceae bacterium]|nr:UDP-3-O-[3-hydroxymyristoyl] N-acetylglucosamine deacetylase [Waddliaceae bacterium]